MAAPASSATLIQVLTFDTELRDYFNTQVAGPDLEVSLSSATASCTLKSGTIAVAASADGAFHTATRVAAPFNTNCPMVLQLEQAGQSPWPVPLRSVVTVRRCPVGYQYSPETSTCSECAIGSYSLDEGGTCHACPKVGVECLGGDRVRLQRGFWTNPRTTSLDAIPCPPGFCCPAVRLERHIM